MLGFVEKFKTASQRWPRIARHRRTLYLKSSQGLTQRYIGTGTHVTPSAVISRSYSPASHKTKTCAFGTLFKARMMPLQKSMIERPSGQTNATFITGKTRS